MTNWYENYAKHLAIDNTYGAKTLMGEYLTSLNPEKTLYDLHCSATIPAEKHEKLIELVQSLYGPPIRHEYTGLAGANKTTVFMREDRTFVRIEQYGTLVQVYAASEDNESILEVKNYLEKNQQLVNTQKREIYCVMKDGSGYKLASIGEDKSLLDEDNYDNEVLTAHNLVVSEFSKASTDKGTIAIFSGAPGTGKTYLIRSLINSFDNVIPVIIPSSTIAVIVGPDMLDLLMTIRNQLNRSNGQENFKVLFILEDADDILVQRKDAHMGSIANLLNITDGIIGKLFNIRIIATTNADSIALDEAILRSGRLLTHAIVGPLPYEKAEKVYARIGGQGELPHKKEWVLADIYAHARDNSQTGRIVKLKRTVGFA